MPVIETRIDPSDYARATRMLSGVKNGVERAASRAINKVVRQTRTSVVRQISKQTGMKQKDIRSRHTKMKLSSVRMLIGGLLLIDRALRVINLRPKKTAAGIEYGPASDRKLIPGAFIAKMDTGFRQVFKRRMKPRLPIDEQFGPSLLSKVDLAAVDTKVKASVGKEFNRQIGVLLEKARG